MEDSSMLCEHTLFTSGDIADANSVYSGWPAKQVDEKWYNNKDTEPSGLVCPMCRGFPKDTTSTPCGHLFCRVCVLVSFVSRLVLTSLQLYLRRPNDAEQVPRLHGIDPVWRPYSDLSRLLAMILAPRTLCTPCTNSSKL